MSEKKCEVLWCSSSFRNNFDHIIIMINCGFWLVIEQWFEMISVAVCIIKTFLKKRKKFNSHLILITGVALINSDTRYLVCL